MVAPGGGRAWDTMRYGDTVNERAVRILLECILVANEITIPIYFTEKNHNHTSGGSRIFLRGGCQLPK